MRHRLLLATVLHLALFCSLLLMLRSPPALTIDLDSTSNERFAVNFLPPEHSGATTFRWSTAGSRLLLYGTAGRQVRLSLQLNGDVRASSSDPRLLIQADEQPIAAIDLQPGWRVYHTLLPAHATGSGLATTPLDLQFTTYRPIPDDSRHLGTPIDRVQVTPLGSGTWIIAHWSTRLLVQPLLLTWAVAVLTALFWMGMHRAWSRFGTRFTLLTLLFPLLAALILLFWTHSDPYTLAWLLETRLPVALHWLLAAVTLSLLLWWVKPLLSHRMPNVRTSLHFAPYAVLLLAHLLLLPPLPVTWRCTAALVVLGMPGALLARWLLRPASAEHDPDDPSPDLTLLFVGLCGGVAFAPFLLLALHAIPGPLPWWIVLAACDGLSIVLLMQKRARMTQKPVSSSFSAAGSLYAVPHFLFVVLLVGAVLRLLLLGSSEFQGDEGRAILMAAGVMHGQDEILMLHRKGPIEILLPAGAMILTGHLNEWGARLPFALAGIGVLLGSYLLAARMLADTRQAEASVLPSPHPAFVAVLASAVLALEGYLIAFSRIVQYQSIVVLMSLAAVWCGWHFYAGSPHPRRWLAGTAWMVATGFLAHYDTIYVVPVLVWLVVAGGLRRGWGVRQWVSTLAVPVLVGAALLASFYLPFVLHERFQRTAAYLVGRTGQQETSGALFNNLPLYYLQGSFYNTTFQMHTLAALLALALLVWLWRFTHPRGVGMVLAGLLLVGCVIQVWEPARFQAAGINLAGFVFGLPLVGLVLPRGPPAPLRMLLIWFGVPFIALAFLINDPRTHFYTMHTPAALLIGVFVGQLVAWLHARRQRIVIALLASASAGLVLLALPYLFIVYVRQSPEYYRTFPAQRPPLYHASYGDTLPTEEGYFGFPSRDGWKVAGVLSHQGVLEGDYDCNQKPRITGWYMRGVFRCGSNPEYYMLALHEPVTSRSLRKIATYDLFGYVLVDNHKTMEIYSREPVTHPPRPLDLEAYVSAFDAIPVTDFPLQQSLPLIPGLPQHHLDVEWQYDMLLKGYDLDREQIESGETATLSLYWLPLKPAEFSAELLEPQRLAQAPLRNYELVVNIIDSNGKVAVQATPHCGSIPPAEWHSRYEWLTYFGHTAFTITADEQMPTGSYTVQVGLRHTQTGAWLPLQDGRETLQFAAVQVVE